MTTVDEKHLTTFERLVVPRRLPFWVFWPAIALLVYAAGETLVRVISEYYYLWPRVLITWAVAFIPVTHIWIAHWFIRVMPGLFKPLADNKHHMIDLIDRAYVETFTLVTRASKIVVSFIAVSALVTVVLIGLPFESAVLNAVALPLFTLFAALCGQALHITIALLFWLGRIVRQPMTSPFFLIPRRTIADLQTFYFVLGFVVTLLYAGLIVAVWRGPYDFHLAILVWLTCLALYPLAIFVVSVIHIHRMMQVLKQKHLAAVNENVAELSKNVLINNDWDRIENLSTLMDIQTKVQRMKEWPLATPNAPLALLLALITAATHLVILVLELFNG